MSVQQIGVTVEQRVKGAVCDDDLAQLVDVTAEEDDQPEDGDGGQGHDTSGPHRGREREEIAVRSTRFDCLVLKANAENKE